MTTTTTTTPSEMTTAALQAAAIRDHAAWVAAMRVRREEIIATLTEMALHDYDWQVTTRDLSETAACREAKENTAERLAMVREAVEQNLVAHLRARRAGTRS